ncbi:hypothetical protein COCCADRAFT_26686 [Bipolaris zeicola 26-R-13]|uniref:Uncharacterized protein n=1 Tax=Cochliobolus carbonum (strain 26-R-13) TaxID=930089 RepID=W6XZF6_COCC2|nr:uncharacterized protein COCCADRAFT_26686 [Bipolaris zeicola 26-R-13]EUC32872.1 hypothetical protein COCCADRAFT_26686 [Bipolaris zeicola 26-R-13]
MPSCDVDESCTKSGGDHQAMSNAQSMTQRHPPRQAKDLGQGPPAEEGFSHITHRTPAAPASSGPTPGANVAWQKDTQRQGPRRTMQGPLVEKARGMGGREGGKKV